MPTYEYRCGECGSFELRRSLAERAAAERTGRAEAAEPERCPRCGRAARRLFGAPALRGTDPAMRRALHAQERSAHEPTVVSAPPPSRRPILTSTDPRHLRLPRR